MRIALITDGVWPYVLGGMQKHSYYLCKYLAQLGVQVDLYHFNESDHDIGTLHYFSAREQANIRSIVLRFPRGWRIPGHYLRDSYAYSRHAGLRVLENGPYDFVYTKGFTGWWLSGPGRRRLRGPLGVNFHGFEMFQRAPDLRSLLQQKLLLRGTVRRICRRADVVFSYGPGISAIIRRIGVPQEKILESPAGIEENSLAEGIMPAAEKTRFVFLGRYERRKGIEELNAAIGRLERPVLDRCEFHFIGPIPDRKKRDGCHYHGVITDPDKLRRKLRECDVLVCPSWSEGMPNVILEAMSQGLAVMATNVGANSSMAHQGTGWLLPSSEPRVIAGALKAAVELPRGELDLKKHHALSQAGSQFVWEKIAPRLLEALRGRITSHEG